MKFEKILVPVDFSDHSRKALETANSLVEGFGAQLELLHVVPDQVVLAPPYAPSLPPDYAQQLEQSAGSHLADWADEYAPSDTVVHTHVRRGDPATQITGLARDVGADLIVMGTKGLTGLRHLVLGSVAERTLRLAPCPVLSVKHDEEPEAGQ
jgi:universal stress protein A